MKQQIRILKLNLKEIAKNIRDQKKVRKKSHPHHNVYKGDYALLELKQEYRHKHVAYCLARGRTLGQVDSGEKLNLDKVDWILKAMQPDSKEKLYVVVNQLLSPSQQAVQSAHAVAEFLKKYPNTLWSNGHLVLLKDTYHIDGNMKGWGHDGEYAEFIEPDLNNKVTAYAMFGHLAAYAMKGKTLL